MFGPNYSDGLGNTKLEQATALIVQLVNRAHMLRILVNDPGNGAPDAEELECAVMQYLEDVLEARERAAGLGLCCPCGWDLLDPLFQYQGEQRLFPTHSVVQAEG